MMNQHDKIQEEPNGTTIVAIKTNDSVVIAADRKVTTHISTMKKDMNKILPVNENVLLGAAGNVGHLQQIHSEVTNKADKYKHQRGYNMTPKNVIHTVKNKFLDSFYFTKIAIVGYESNEPIIYCSEPTGSIIEFDPYLSFGSGSSFALGMLENSYSEDMNTEEVVELAEKAIRIAIERDNMSGNGIYIGIVNKDGYELKTVSL